MALGIASAALDTTGKSLAIVINGDTAPILPASGATGIVVKADGIVQTQVSATAASHTVTVTLLNAINSAATVTFDYAPGNITDSAGSPLVLGTVTAHAVTNNSTVAAAIAIVSATLGTNGTTLIITTTGGVAPLVPSTAITGFVVKSNGVTRTQASAVSAGDIVTITLSSPIDTPATVTFDYTAGNLVDSTPVTPLALGTITAHAATNNSTVSSHATLTGAAVLAANGKNITVTIGGSPTLPLNPVPSFGTPSGFTFYIDGVSAKLSDSYTSASTVVVVLKTGVSGGAALTWAYASGNICDSAATPATLHSYAGQTVTNNSTAGPSAPTVLTGTIISQTNRTAVVVDPDAASFKIYKDGSGTALATVNSPTDHYDDVVTDGLPHYYRTASVYSTHVGELSPILHFPAAPIVVDVSDTITEGADGRVVRADPNPTI